MNQKEIKQELLHKCKEHLSIRRAGVEETLANIKVSLQEETKSTAGDKHETGRAMLQLEREKAGQQLAQIEILESVLSKISENESQAPVHLGSVVKTSQANYFLSIPAGELTVDNETYYAIGIASPIGKLLLGKSEGDVVRSCLPAGRSELQITVIF